MDKLKKIALRVLYPGEIWIILLIPLGAAALIFTFVTNREETVIGYISYVLSAYAATIFSLRLPDMVPKVQSFIRWFNPVRRVKSLMYSNKYGRRYMTDIPFRTRVSLYTGLAMNLIFAAFKLIAGIHYASFWYGADALFYVILSTAQVLMLRHIRKKEESMENQFRQYRFCGIVLFVLNAALTGVVYQVVNQGMGYHYPGLLVYVVATYAFFCLTLAIINIVKYRKLNSPALSAVKALRLAKAFVAIFALQTAMLVSFGAGESENFNTMMKALTGGGVCILLFGMAVYMVVRANKNLKKLSINNLETKL